MPGRFMQMLIGFLVVVLVGGFIATRTILDWKIIPPGWSGIKVNRLVARGITREDVVTGFVFYNPIQSEIVLYPTFVQRVVWTHDLKEGNPVNEELSFNTKDAVPVNIDVAVSYILDSVKVTEFYTKFRADRIDTWTHSYLRDSARNVVVAVGSEYNFDDINGAKKEEFLAHVTESLNDRLVPLGVHIQQFGLVGALRPSPALVEAVNAKTKAIQDAIKTENEVRAAQAEAKKRVAIAEGEAAANRALASSLNPTLLDWERLKLQREAIAKWDGRMPQVLGSSGTGGILFNIPTSSQPQSGPQR